MNALFTDTMTVYNYHRDHDTEKETWLRSEVKGVQWSHNKTETVTSGNVQTENKVESITINFQRDYGNKPYLPPTEFSKLTVKEAAGYWTLNARSGQDVIVLGKSDREISREYRLNELLDDFPHAVTITAVSDKRNRPRLKHIKVTGK
ncbi:MAG: hypothetical protein ACI4EX_01815 [Lachnospiraceae bacterium]